MAKDMLDNENYILSMVATVLLFIQKNYKANKLKFLLARRVIEIDLKLCACTITHWNY